MALDRAGTWSYTGNPADSQKDRVRFLCGDIDDTDAQVSDEEIAAALAYEGSALGAAASVCEHLASRYAREAQKSIGAGGGLNTSVSLSERSRAYAARAKDLRQHQEARAIVGMAYAGGISRADKDAVASNTDRVPPEFFVGMMEHP